MVRVIGVNEHFLTFDLINELFEKYSALLKNNKKYRFTFKVIQIYINAVDLHLKTKSSVYVFKLKHKNTVIFH